MSIVRVHKTENYTTVHNGPFNDERLSWHHRGMLAYLLIKPDGWEISMVNLFNSSPDTDHMNKKIMRELEEWGYVTRFRKSENRKWKWVSNVYEVPVPEDQRTYNGKLKVSIESLSNDAETSDKVNTNTLVNTNTNVFVEPEGKLEETNGVEESNTNSPIKDLSKDKSKKTRKKSDRDLISDELIDRFKILSRIMLLPTGGTLGTQWVRPLLQVYYLLQEVNDVDTGRNKYAYNEFTIDCTARVFEKALKAHKDESADGEELSIKSPQSVMYKVNGGILTQALAVLKDYVHEDTED